MRIRSVDPGCATLAGTNRWRWQDHSACREAKDLSVCARFPLVTQQACLEAALVSGPTGQYGVQGGMTARQRIVERRSRMRRVGRAA